MNKLSKNISPLGAWAFSIGTSIGWGSLVVTTNSYLAQSGPYGSIIGLVIGGIIMLVIGANYAYLIEIYPEAGGAYTFTREAFSHDHGFLTAWFLSLTYLAVLWANATSLPLFARYFIGDTFKLLKLFSVFGYDVYLGEALFSVAALCGAGYICARWKVFANKLMVAMAVMFTVGILICFAGSFFHKEFSINSGYVPDAPVLKQIVWIAVISPWAFIGFENISHFSEETTFPRSFFFKILSIVVVSTTLLYICITLLSVTAYPPEYDSWLSYIRDSHNLSGIEGIPAFYAASYYMGDTGVSILMISLLALILTSLIGNTTAISRLFYSLGKDRVLPHVFSNINRFGAPGKAIMLVIAISAIVPFLGRTAIGWIVDVTTFGATLVYGLVSGAAFKIARRQADKANAVCGLIGIIVMIGFGLYLTLPNFFSEGTLENESYLLFIFWAILGFIYFRIILQYDKARRFGNSIVVWIALFSLILFISLVWLCQSVIRATDAGMLFVAQYSIDTGLNEVQVGIVSDTMESVRRVSATSIIGVLFLMAISMVMLIDNFRIMSRRAHISELQLGMVTEMANKDPLTGVKSRHAYMEKERELDEKITDGTVGEFGIVVCDLNGLKFINDTLGHKAGDEAIKQASKLICDFFDHSPVYRNGGDEFIVFLSGRDFESREDIMSAFHDKAVSNIGTGEVVISAGMAVYHKNLDAHLRQTFDRADAAMFKEKQLLKSMGAKSR